MVPEQVSMLCRTFSFAHYRKWLDTVSVPIIVGIVTCGVAPKGGFKGGKTMSGACLICPR